MKKLLKKDLAALAERMPTIKELEQRDYFGGTYYVSGSTYEELGYAGYGDEIYVASDFEWDMIRNGQNGLGTPLARENNYVKQKVLAYYAYRVIGFSGNVNITSNSSDIPITYSDRTLSFNLNVPDSLYYKNALTLALEKAKRDYGIPDSGSGSGSGGISGGVSGGVSGIISNPEAELNAIEAELYELDRKVALSVDKDGMLKKQQPQRKKLAERMFQCWRALGYAGMGYELSDAYRKCRYNPI